MRLSLGLGVVLALTIALAIAWGETTLSPAQVGQAFADPTSAPGQILWSIRAPRAVAAAFVGAALGLAGAVMQGLLRNPLADPGVLGVSAISGLGASIVIVLGLATIPWTVEAAAMGGALMAGAALMILAGRLADPQALILFGVAISALGGAATALVFNLSPSPVATTEVLSWLLGSVANRDWGDVLIALGPLAIGAALCAVSARALRMLTLGEETAALSGLRMSTLRAVAVGGTAILTGTAVAMAGVVGFVGLAAPHLARAAASDDPAKTLLPSGLFGAVLLVAADLATRLIPSSEELRLGVVTALFGSPAFAVIAWRAARSWRT